MNIKVLNKISELGISILKDKNYTISEDHSSPDALLVRSAKLHEEKFNENLKAIGRAGAGVNNIPIDRCTDSGIVVFNTPGANANAVKELVLTGMFLSSRDIIGGIEFAESIKDKNEDDIHKLVESNKSRFKGIELKGKNLGVIGLGAIGVLVANSATNLGLKLAGYDPFISVDRAWGLSRSVIPSKNLNNLLSNSDFITLHMPFTSRTDKFLNKKLISKLKDGAVVLNFARPEIVDENAVVEALKSGKISKYVTDFPSKVLLNESNVIAIPHLGASTNEAEDNCALMIADQIDDYLANGNISNSVNFPNCSMERTGQFRIAIANRNIPNMVGQITKVLADHKLNIVEMLNKSKDELAYNILDINGSSTESFVDELKNIEGVIFVRLI
ncbi:3-phosphoglycerate dehydrogenase [Candidatus Marinamargulisbacteria bacterium SCGC AAA071-K20]|nr:3-phosphoglycerate dehydrogenase [Candidatus Marinamargulisbacteria bacterium SCGC AAA071-K20]